MKKVVDLPGHLGYLGEERNTMRAKVEKITVDMSKEIKTEIKVIAARRHMTIREWVLKAVAAAILEDQKYTK